MPSECENNLQAVLSSLQDFLFVLDTKGKVLHYSPNVIEHSNYTPEEVNGRDIFDFYPKEKRAEIAREFTEILEGEKESCLAPMIDKNRSLIPAVIKLNKARWNGEDALICTVRDISERARTHEQLKECQNKLDKERKKLETTLENIGGGVLVLDMNKKIIMVNDEALKMSGFDRDEIVYTKYNEKLKFANERTKEETTPFIEEVYKKGTVNQTDYYTALLTKDGSAIPVADLITPTKNGKGDVIGCVITFRDVTKEREIDRMKSDFVSVAAHQLRTPLGSIRWNLEMLLVGDLGPIPKEVANILGQIHESTDRLTKLVNYLLDISRIEQGAVKYELVPTQIETVIESLSDELKPMAREKNISMRFAKPGEPLPKVLVDPKKLHEVLLNVISNAIKYNDHQSGGFVEVSITSDENEFVINVADNGIGIPRKDQGNMFTRFFRGEKARKSSTEGTGLGLFVVKSYVEEWGGKVWFDSHEGLGTVFYISIPRHYNRTDRKV